MGFIDRTDLAAARVHGRPAWGIHGTKTEGAYAIVLNGGYEDDDDRGETITYTGHGKGHNKSAVSGQYSGIQQGDQDWTQGNKAMKISSITQKPVRVIRGPDANELYAPTEGYRYDGLYQVISFQEEIGRAGHRVLKFELVRCADQDPLPPADVTLWWRRTDSNTTVRNPPPPSNTGERKKEISKVAKLRMGRLDQQKLMGITKTRRPTLRESPTSPDGQ